MLSEHFQTRPSIINLDYDHTISGEGVRYDEDLRFDISQQSEVSKANLNLLIEQALKGQAISIVTARDRTAFVISDYIQKELLARAEQMHLQYDETDRLVTPEGLPIIFIMANDNGAIAWDILDPTHKFIHGIKLKNRFWEAITDPPVTQLLSRSTPQTRYNSLQLWTPQYQGAPTDVLHTVGKFGLVSAMQSRVNLELDYKLISTDPELQTDWFEHTGVLIAYRASLLEAFAKLSEDWGIYFTGSNTNFNIDIVDQFANKGSCVSSVNAYICSLYKLYGLEISEDDSAQIGDTPLTSEFNGNDGPMLLRKGGISVTKTDLFLQDERGLSWPLIYSVGNSREERTNNLLNELFAIEA